MKMMRSGSEVSVMALTALRPKAIAGVIINDVGPEVAAEAPLDAGRRHLLQSQADVRRLPVRPAAAQEGGSGPVGHLEKVVVEFISALLHGVRRKNRHSSFWLKRVADAGLTSEKPAGKFEKLLRSDP